MAESLRFEVVPIWEPRFLYSFHSGVACHPLCRCEASFFCRYPFTALRAGTASGQRRPRRRSARPDAGTLILAGTRPRSATSLLPLSRMTGSGVRGHRARCWSLVLDATWMPKPFLPELHATHPIRYHWRKESAITARSSQPAPEIPTKKPLRSRCGENSCAIRVASANEGNSA